MRISHTTALSALFGLMLVAAPTLAADRAATKAVKAKPAKQEMAARGKVADFLKSMLLGINEASVEVGRIGIEKANNPAVKDLAEKVVADHRDLHQDLVKMTKSKKGDSAKTAARGKNAKQGGYCPLSHLGSIQEDACKMHLEMTKKMLSKQKGQNFDMAYLVHTISSHTWLLAELKAIGDANVQCDELQAHVDRAQNVVTEHLEMAKELAKKIEDNERASR